MATVPISAKNNDGIKILISEVKNLSYSPLDIPYTDQTEKSLAAELIRREIIEQISEEIPYQIAIKVEEFSESFDQAGKRTRVQINATIICERESHKKILLGKKGQQIAAIGKGSRKKIEKMLDTPSDLMLFVKVSPDWRNSHSYLKELGYISQICKINKFIVNGKRKSY